MRRLIRVGPFLAIPLLLLASACWQSESGPTELEPSLSTFGDFAPIPEVAYVGGVFGPGLFVLSVPEMRQIGHISIPVGTPQQFTISSNGHLGYVSHIDPVGVTKLDLRTGEAVETAPLPEGSGPFDLKVTPDGKRLFVSLFYARRVAAIDTRTMEVLAEIPLTDDTDLPNGMSMGPGGQQVFVANQGSGRVHAIDTRTLEVVTTIETGFATVNEVAVTQNGDLAFITAPGYDQVMVFNLRTHSIAGTVTVEQPRGVTIPAHGREAYVTGNVETVAIDTKTLEVVASFPYPGIRIALNTNGRLAMTTRGVLRLFDVTEPALVAELDIERGIWDADFAVDPAFIKNAPDEGVQQATSTTGVPMTVLSPLPGGWMGQSWAVNKKGHVVGGSTSWEGERATLWIEGEGLHDLGVLPGDAGSWALDLNDAGQVVGYSSPEPGPQINTLVATLWSGETGILELGSLGGNSLAYAINKAGDVVGYSFRPEGPYHAFLWTSEDGMTDLGLPGGERSRARGINDRQEVVGFSFRPTGGYYAFHWTAKDGTTELDNLDGNGSAWDINLHGQIAGHSQLPSGQWQAVRWTRTGDVLSLGDLGGPSFAYGISDRGAIAGQSNTPSGETHAFLWTEEDGMVDLGRLPDGEGWSGARDVNAAGDVVGRATIDGVQYAVIWHTGRPGS
jgi:probable HAF family extracellular repeat protein/YVTN family beta-propeller protein